MAQIIKIKRSDTTAVPTSLSAGELAYSSNSDKLFIGQPGNEDVVTIGGKLYTDLLTVTAGNLTASKPIIVDSSSKINNLKVDELDFDGNTISSSSGNINITPGGSGRIVLDGQQWPATAGVDGYLLSTNSSGDLVWVAATANANNAATTLEAGNGLSGGGTFTANNSASSTITFAVSTGAGLEINSDAVRIADNGVTTAKINGSAVTAAKIANGAVTTDKLAIAAVQTNKLTDNAVSTAKINGSAVTAAKIANGAVTEAKIGGSAVTAAKIANNAVTSAKILPDAITNAKMANNAVNTAEIVNSAVTNEKLANSSVTAVKIDSGAVTNEKLANSSVTAVKIDSGAVTTAKIANDAVTAVKLANNAITTDKIDTGAVTNAKLSNSSLTIGSTEIALGSTSTTIAGLTQVDISDIRISGSSIISTNTNGNINITPNGNGAVVIDGLSYPTADGDSNQVLTTDGSGNLSFADAANNANDATINIVAGDGLSNGGSFTTDQSTSANITLTVNTAEGLEISSDNVQIADGGVSTDKLAGSAVTTAKISNGAVTTDKIGGSAITTAKITNGAVTNAKLANSSVTIGSTGVTLGNTQTSFAGITALTVDNLQLGVSGNNTIDTSSGDLTLGGNVAITGDLTVSGSTTTINTTTLSVSAGTITLNNGQTGAPVNNGVLLNERGTSADTFLRWNETTDYWELSNSAGAASQILSAANFDGAVTEIDGGTF